MKKQILFFAILAIVLVPQVSKAFTADKIINNQAPSVTIYASMFDQLVMDITLMPPNGTDDVLTALTLQNQGNAKEATDIYKFILWQDAGTIGFDGMGIDQKIGEFSFLSNNYSWYIDNLNVPVPTSGVRLFVSLEVATSVTDFYWLQMKIPTLIDYNNNGSYDLGDLGVYFVSSNSGPTDNFVLNSQVQTFRHSILDTRSPKVNITSPQTGELINQNSYLIKGLARDQGASAPIWVMVGIRKDNGEENWYDATLKELNGKELSWEYNWTNIENGDYELRVKSADSLYGNGISGQLVQIKVDNFAQQSNNNTPVATTTDNNSSAISNTPATTTTQTGGMTLSQLQARIQELNKLLDQLQMQLKGTTAGSVGPTGNQNQTQNQAGFTFQNNLKLGDKNDDVKKMQEILIGEGLMASGLNTGYFGPITQKAVIAFQEKYQTEVLAPYGLTKGTGFVGQSTRAKLNTIY